MSVPVCDEFQFLELIRDDVMLTSVPVIIITGSNRLEDEVRCLELGAVDFVRKPYNVRILKSKDQQCDQAERVRDGPLSSGI